MSITPDIHELNAIIVEQAKRIESLNRLLDDRREEIHQLLRISQQHEARADRVVASAADSALLTALLYELGLPASAQAALLAQRDTLPPETLARQMAIRLGHRET